MNHLAYAGGVVPAQQGWGSQHVGTTHYLQPVVALGLTCSEAMTGLLPNT